MKKGSIFPAGKIKKIMQENQEVGKLSNVVPHLIERSLQLFLDSLTDKINQIAENYQLGKVQAPILKKAIQEMQNYQFMKQFVQDIEEFDVLKKKKSQVKAQKLMKKRSSKQQGQKPKRRAKKKTSQIKQKSNEEEQQHQEQIEMNDD